MAQPRGKQADSDDAQENGHEDRSEGMIEPTLGEHTPCEAAKAARQTTPPARRTRCRVKPADGHAETMRRMKRGHHQAGPGHECAGATQQQRVGRPARSAGRCGCGARCRLPQAGCSPHISWVNVNCAVWPGGVGRRGLGLGIGTGCAQHPLSPVWRFELSLRIHVTTGRCAAQLGTRRATKRVKSCWYG